MSAKLTLVALVLVAGLAIGAHAAGGIKGNRLPADNSQQRLQSVKGPAANRPQQQAYLAPAQQAQLPVQQQAIKAGPGAVAPVFTAIRVAAPAPQPQPQPQIVQQQQQQQEQIQEPEIVQQQQQQQVQQQVQEQEIDPNAAAQDSAPAVVAPARAAAAAAAAASEEEANPRPEPYAFQYAFNSGDSATSGSSAREEQQDASGRVTGFYTLKGEDGRDRRVDYVADASGFRATISTNEMGTADKDSADADWNAQSPSEGQLRSAELARQRALANPQQQEIQQPIGAASSSSSFSSSKISSPRAKGLASNSNLSKINVAPQQQQQQQQVQITQQLQEPFEQIRQTELNTRARKSRHAPFYLYTI